MLVLTKQQREEILRHCLQALPYEACGLLGGRGEGETQVVEKVYLLSNVDKSREHFSMDPQEQFAAIKHMRSNGWEMLGNFHSHPETPARPSAEDKRWAFDSRISYLILSLSDPAHPVLKSFKIQKETVREEEMMIKEDA